MKLLELSSSLALATTALMVLAHAGCGSEFTSAGATSAASGTGGGATTTTTTTTGDGGAGAGAATVTGVGGTSTVATASVTAASSSTGMDCAIDCDPGLVCCDGACVGTYNDILNCGECGNSCGGEHPFCDNGICAQMPPCTKGVLCDSGGLFCCGVDCCYDGQICCVVPQGGPVGTPVCTDDPTCPVGCPTCE
jgi:hypothetical protein